MRADAVVHVTQRFSYDELYLELVSDPGIDASTGSATVSRRSSSRTQFSTDTGSREIDSEARLLPWKRVRALS